MTDQELTQLVQDKLNEAYKANEHPHKFYNAVLQDVMRVMQQAMTDILKEVLKK